MAMAWGGWVCAEKAQLSGKECRDLQKWGGHAPQTSRVPRHSEYTLGCFGRDQPASPSPLLLPAPGLRVRVWSHVRVDALCLHRHHGLQHHVPHHRALR
jgi:hypothetical protein